MSSTFDFLTFTDDTLEVSTNDGEIATTMYPCKAICGGLGGSLIDETPNDSCTDESGSCPVGYFNATSCCVNQWWIIGVAAGVGGLLIIIFMSVTIWLSVDRKKTKKKMKQNKNKDLEKHSYHGQDNHSFGDPHDATPRLDVEMPAAIASATDIRPEPEIHGYDTEHRHDDHVHLVPAINTDGGSELGYPDGYGVARAHSPGGSNVNSEQRTSALYPSQLYDDIAHFHGDTPRSDGGPNTYYNVENDRVKPPSLHLDTHPSIESRLDKQGVADNSPRIEPRQDEHKNIGKPPAPKPTSIRIDSHIDMGQFKDFEANLNNVDPSIDYKIKRPQFD